MGVVGRDSLLLQRSIKTRFYDSQPVLGCQSNWIAVTKLTGVSFISSEIPIEKKSAEKISEQAPGTLENGFVHPSSGYVNVALNLGVV